MQYFFIASDFRTISGTRVRIFVDISHSTWNSSLQYTIL